MQQELEAFCVALEELSKAVLAGWSGEQTFTEVWGWNCPAVSRHDMAAVPMRLAQEIRAIAPEALSADLIARVADYPRRLLILQSQTVPQFWGSNCGASTSVYLVTLDNMRSSLNQVIGWQTNPDQKTMPPQLARRLRSLKAEMDQIEPEINELSSKIDTIQKAHEAAESLPVDLQALSGARESVIRMAGEANKATEEIKANAGDATNLMGDLKSKQNEASKLVENCEEAYRITTTKGLAAAFDQRANRLANSMVVWVFGLMAALAAGAVLGANRVEILSKVISAVEPQWGVIWMHVVLSLLSIGAPVWFAWIATKQIGQRFRLAEDYAFKASVAKAYEGYRKEAARIDPAFEARLFGSALTRLEEAPLRLVETETHGSPWHEFFASAPFQNALSVLPDLKDRFLKLTYPATTAAPPA